MKKSVIVFLLVFGMSAMLIGCGTKNEKASGTSAPSNSENNESQNNESQKDETQKDDSQNNESQKDESQNKITAEMAYEGVNNYCHSEYDWSAAEENTDIMYVEKGEETETEYQVVFRSYTGAFVYFYVDKSSGSTRLVEYVPNLDIEEEAGTINIYDYLEAEEK